MEENQEKIAFNINLFIKSLKKNDDDKYNLLRDILNKHLITNNKKYYMKNLQKNDFIQLIDEIRWFLYDINDINLEVLKNDIENYLFICGSLYF